MKDISDGNWSGILHVLPVYTLILNFPSKGKEDEGQGNQSPLKKQAPGVVASQHEDKKHAQIQRGGPGVRTPPWNLKILPKKR